MERSTLVRMHIRHILRHIRLEPHYDSEWSRLPIRHPRLLRTHALGQIGFITPPPPLHLIAASSSMLRAGVPAVARCPASPNPISNKRHINNKLCLLSDMYTGLDRVRYQRGSGDSEEDGGAEKRTYVLAKLSNLLSEWCLIRSLMHL